MLHRWPAPARSLALAGVLASAGLTMPNLGHAQDVVWDVVTPEEASTPIPASDAGVQWRTVQEPGAAEPAGVNTSNAIVWRELDPPSDSAPSTQVVWQDLPASADPLPPEAIAEQHREESNGSNPQPPPPLPPLPRLQALDRSIAFSDGNVGPDISWNIPNGLRWSERWFASASLLGQSRRQPGEDFFAWNNGDSVAIVHANVIQSGSWSLGLNTSIRSVYQGSQAAGGGTQVGEGVSSGFRVATAIGDTGGIAFGGEQVIQWDDDTDTGRNLYLMASKGWWLGDQGRGFPLFVANGGIGTGRFANQDILSWDNPLRFACIDGVENRTGTFSVDNDLCWSPIGTLALVVNEYWSMFVEYRSGTAQAATSLSLGSGIPLRFTWGVNFAGKNEVIETNQWTWVFRASLGF